MSYPVLTNGARKPVRTIMGAVDGSTPMWLGIARVRAVAGMLRQRTGGVIERVAYQRSGRSAAHVSIAETGFQQFKKATSFRRRAGHVRGGLFALAISAGIGVAAFSPGSAYAQARTIWGTVYTDNGAPPARTFSVTLPGVTASTATTLLPCWQTSATSVRTVGVQQAFNGTNSATAGFYAPAIPAGTNGITLLAAGFSGAAGCTPTSIPNGAGTTTAYASWNMVMSFSAPVDPRALRFQWMNLDAGIYQFNDVTPNRLAGNSVFTVNGAYVHPVAAIAINAGCRANNGSNPSASCGSVNFSAPTSTISSLSFNTYDVDATAGGSDGHMLALSLTQPSLLIRKQTVGAVGSNAFTFNYPANVVTNAAAGTTAATTETITVAANNAFVNGAQRYIANSGLNTTITEAVPAGWVTTAASCYDVANANAVLVSLAAPVMGPANAALTIPTASIAPTSQIQCDFTNNRQAPLQLAKAWAANSHAGDQVTIGATTGGANNTASFGATAPTAANSGTAVFVNIGDVITLPVETGDIGIYTTAIACTGGHTLSGTNGQQANNTLTITSSNAATCTYTNTANPPTIQLTKALGNNRVANTDQFTVQIRTGSASGAVVNSTANSTTTGSGSVVTAGTGTTGVFTAAAGTQYFLTEAASGSTVLGNYDATITCTDASGIQAGLPSGAAFSGSLAITPVGGAAISCTLTNAPNQVDLSITKTNTFAPGDPSDHANDTLVSGATTTYTLVVTNNGPATVTGAAVTDPAGTRTGLTCPGANVVTITQPSGSSTSTVSALSGAGVVLGTLANGQSATLTFSCTVN